MPVRLREGLRVEEIDGDAIVLDRKGSSVHRFTGDAVEALRLLADDLDPADVPDHLVPAFDELVAAGVVANPAQWSRRKVLMAGGAAWGAATVASFGLSLPAAAQALSMCPDGQMSTGATTYTSNGTYNTGPAELSVLVRAWGGGGGGGGGNLTASGGGGGGGQYVYNPAVSVAPCSMYSVVVGGGGAAGPMGAGATAGGTSSFGGTLLTAGGGAGGAYGGGMSAAGGSGGMGGTVSFNGGSGGLDASGNGGGGGGGGGHAGAGGNGSTSPNTNGALGGAGTGGPGTPGGGAGGDGRGGDALYTMATAANPGNAPGGAGGGAPQGLATAFGQGVSGGAGARGEVRVGV